MKRMFGAAVVGLVSIAAAQAHFPFIVPEADGSRAKVVFSDSFEPDANVDITKLANTKLAVRDATGKETALEWKKGDACYLVDLPGSGDRVVYGTTDYGVLQKGDAKPFRLMYYPKAVIGKAAAPAVGEKLALEVVATGDPGKTKFRVLAAGKPVPEAEVSVMVPGTVKRDVKTDKEGFTPAFAETGRYGVYAKLIEAKAGESAGKKFDEVRHYATLVADVK